MRLIFTIFLTSIILSSCKQEDLTPSYIKIDAISLTTIETSQGANSHGITDAWIYLDNKPIGVFEIPCVLPILEEGEHNVVVYAGIKKNGIANTRLRYPFYKRWESNETLIKGDTLTLQPSFSYKTSVKMELLEDFEDAGIDFDSYGWSDTTIKFVSDPSLVKYGNKCGGMHLTSADNLILVQTINDLQLTRGAETYVEIDYYNVNTLGMGVIANNSGFRVDQPIHLILNAQNADSVEWKKVYIDIQENVNKELSATSYGIFLVSTLDEGVLATDIYIDNIKVVRYQ